METQGQPGSEYCLARKNEANNCHIFSCKQSSLDILQNVTLRTRVHNRLGQTTGQSTVEVLKVSVVVKPGSKCDQLLDVGLLPGLRVLNVVLVLSILRPEMTAFQTV